jgi:hypothetical protein
MGGGIAMHSSLSDDILRTVKKRLGKTITGDDLAHVAKQIKPSVLRDETALRKLIKQVSTLAGIPVTEATTKEIIAAITDSKATPQQLEALMRQILRK